MVRAIRSSDWRAPRRSIERCPSLAGSAHDQGPQRTHVDVAESNRTVVALDHERIQGRLRNLEMRPGRAGGIDIPLYQLAIEEDAEEARRLDLLAGGIEPRRSEPRLIGLPLSRPPRRVHERRRSADALLVDPPVIDRTGIG